MHRLSQQSDDVQLAVANLLVTGEHRTFKRAFTIAFFLIGMPIEVIVELTLM